MAVTDGSDLENPRQRIHNPLVGIAGNLAAWGFANIQLPIMPCRMQPAINLPIISSHKRF